MSAVPSRDSDPGLEKLANAYVDSILRFYENGSFAVFSQSGHVYAGVSQPLCEYEGTILVRVIRVQQPLKKELVPYLTEKASPKEVLEVDEDILFDNRGLFYASLHKGKLHELTDAQKRYLTTANLF